LVQIAYRQLAEKGFEGLRVRDVAAEAGINNATLHYYYPTKEALIQGVVSYLIQEFMASRTPRQGRGADTPLGELRREFEDARIRFRESPEMGVVLMELLARSRRDPAIARILQQLDAGWRGYLMSLLERGIREGVFHPEIDPAAMAAAIMVQIKGLGLQAMIEADAAALDRLVSQLVAQIERWLTG
jgi:TetR/AcrR family transcriptional regulator, regulator of cefoperazone and chloramphenicol sensitivity